MTNSSHELHFNAIELPNCTRRLLKIPRTSMYPNAHRTTNTICQDYAQSVQLSSFRCTVNRLNGTVATQHRHQRTQRRSRCATRCCNCKHARGVHCGRVDFVGPSTVRLEEAQACTPIRVLTTVFGSGVEGVECDMLISSRYDLVLAHRVTRADHVVQEYARRPCRNSSRRQGRCERIREI